MKLHTIEVKEISYPVGLNMQDALYYISKVADFLKKEIPKEKEDIAIFCTGSSGAILSALLSVELEGRDICINHVKKEGEISHSRNSYYMNSDSISIILDDFTFTGESLERIKKSIVEKRGDSFAIDYLILSAIGTNSTQKIIDYIKPLNIISSEEGISNIETALEEILETQNILL